MSAIAPYFRDKVILITGATGFLGKPLVAKILADLPHIRRIYLLIREKQQGDGAARSAEDRLHAELFSSSTFGPLRAVHGHGFEAFVREKVAAVPGELGQDGLGVDPALYARLTHEVKVVINSAAVVGFDAPMDEAVRLNTLSVRHVVSFARACRDAVFLHVSTAYVSSRDGGRIAEALRPSYRQIAERVRAATGRPVPPDLDAEIRDILERCRDVEAASLSAEMLQRFEREAAGGGRRAEGGPSPQDMEAARLRWVRQQLVEEGIRRGKARGWPDVYTFTKALGEQVVAENRGDLPTVILRPSIIESSIAEPEPGWLDGFRMADPIIVGYGKGRLQDFPGDPDVIVDLIPVDYVVNAILAALPRAQAEGGLAVYHVSTGSQNPLTLGALYRITREYFLRYPMRDRQGNPIPAPRWTFPSLRRFRLACRIKYLLPLAAAGWCLEHLLPARWTPRWRRSVAALKAMADRLQYYVQIYGPYLTRHCCFENPKAQALYGSLSPEDRKRFNFDVSQIDWRSYIQNVHIPGIKRHTLKLDLEETEGASEVRGSAEEESPLWRDAPAAASLRAPDDGRRPAAFFDVDGTITQSIIVEHLAHFRWQTLSLPRRILWAMGFAPKLAYYYVLDKVARSRFIPAFYRNYRGLEAAQLRRWAREEYAERLRRKVFPEALEAIQAHKARGDAVVLVTGALDFIVEPLAEFLGADAVLAMALRQQADRFTGELASRPLCDGEKARLIREYAAAHAIALSRSYAYGDSLSDRPMLEAVGNPVAVNPDRRLRRLAQRARWTIRDWRGRG